MAHQMTSRIYIYLLGMFFFCVADAQEDLESLLDELAPLPPQEVMATFKSGKVINLHTNERVAAGNLEMTDEEIEEFLANGGELEFI